MATVQNKNYILMIFGPVGIIMAVIIGVWQIGGKIQDDCKKDTSNQIEQKAFPRAEGMVLKNDIEHMRKQLDKIDKKLDKLLEQNND